MEEAEPRSRLMSRPTQDIQAWEGLVMFVHRAWRPGERPAKPVELAVTDRGA